MLKMSLIDYLVDCLIMGQSKTMLFGLWAVLCQATRGPNIFRSAGPVRHLLAVIRTKLREGHFAATAAAGVAGLCLAGGRQLEQNPW